MGRNGPTLPRDPTKTRDILDFLLSIPPCSLHRQAEPSNPINVIDRPCDKKAAHKFAPKSAIYLLDSVDLPSLGVRVAPCLTPYTFAILRTMSIRNAGGDWEPMLLGIEARYCKVCKEGLYRNKTFFSGGWSRCALCEDFVHYSCLASGKVSFLKARPRVCNVCRTAQERTPPSPPKPVIPVAVGS
jgi:hypothetical protein